MATKPRKQEDGPPPVTIDFTAKKDFWSDELQSQYVKDLSYTVSSELRDLVDKWIDAGKVTEGRPQAKLTGGD